MISDQSLAANELKAKFAVSPFTLCGVKYQEVEVKTSEGTVM